MITVDPRTGSSDLIEPLKRLGLPVEPRTCNADVEFVGLEGGVPVDIGIELKKLPELVQALRSKRLQGHQLVKMGESYKHKWLIVEGEVYVDRRGLLQSMTRSGGNMHQMPGAMTAAELYKRLLTMTMAGGLFYWPTRNRAETLRVIESLYRFWTDCDLEEHRSHLAIYHPQPLTKISQFRYTISTLPGVELERSKWAEAHFQGSLRRAFASTARDWTAIRGFGAVLAKRIQEAIQ